MSRPQSFKIEGHQRWLLLAAPWVFLGFMGLSILVPFIPEDRPRNGSFLYGFAAISGLAWGLGAWYTFRIARRLPLMAVTADDEGLWPSVLPRETSLVPWTAVTALRERPRLQRLDLLSEAGVCLAQLEYQLADFERLRAIVLQRAHLSQAPKTSADGVYGKSPWHHAYSITLMLAFAALGGYVAQTHALLASMGTAFIVGMSAWEYLTSPYQVRLHSQGLDVAWPGRSRCLPRHVITGIDLADEHANHMRHPHVVVQLREPERPLRLKHFRLPALELARVLQAWQRGKA